MVLLQKMKILMRLGFLEGRHQEASLGVAYSFQFRCKHILSTHFTWIINYPVLRHCFCETLPNSFGLHVFFQIQIFFFVGYHTTFMGTLNEDLLGNCHSQLVAIERSNIDGKLPTQLPLRQYEKWVIICAGVANQPDSP